MNMILFIGIQATGKSEFCKRNFYKTHIRINLDMLRTRYREGILVEACFRGKQPFVVDNTNLTAAVRQVYIEEARKQGFEVIGYYFKSAIEDAISRNSLREGKEKLPLAAIRSAHAKLELPSFDEGFDKLFYVHIDNGDFVVEKFQNEICDGEVPE